MDEGVSENFTSRCLKSQRDTLDKYLATANISDNKKIKNDHIKQNTCKIKGFQFLKRELKNFKTSNQKNLTK